MLALAAALLSFLSFLSFFPGFFCRLPSFLFCGLLCGFLLLSRFLCCLLLCCLLLCCLLLGGLLSSFLFRGRLFAATASAGGSSGFGCWRWRRGRHGLTHRGFRDSGFLFFLLFLFEILFERLAVGAAVAEFFFFIAAVECGIVERHCSS